MTGEKEGEKEGMIEVVLVGIESRYRVEAA